MQARLHSRATLPPPGQLARACALALLLALGLAANASAQAGNAAPAQWSQQTEEWINQHLLASANPDLPLRPEVEVGRFDSRLQLAPCARVEPFLPAGTRLWGRTRVGLRCVQGPVAWTVFLPIRVRAWGPAWVLRQPAPAGTPLSANDLEQTEIDWAEHLSPPLARPEQWLGLAPSRNLQAGTVLRQGMVRQPQAFASGSQVRLQVQGPGFTLMASGTALNHGVLGQPVRVRLPNRQVVHGVVLDAETVAVQM